MMARDATLGVLTAAATIVVVIVAVDHPTLALSAVAAIVGGWFAVSRPAPTALLTVIVTQEISTVNLGGYLLRFGNEIYFLQVGPVAPLAYLVFIGSVAAMLHYRTRGNIALTVAAILMAWVFFSSVWQAPNTAPVSALQSGLGQSIHFLLLVAAMAIGWSGSHKDRRALEIAAGLGLATLVIMGVLALMTGQGSSDVGGSIKLYHDTATAAVLSAAAIAVALTPGRRDWRRVAAFAILMATAFLCFRRSIWLGAPFAVVALLLLAVRQRARLVTLALTAACAGAGAIAMAPETVRVGASSSWGQFLDALAMTEMDTSAAGHVNDIQQGLSIAFSSPWSGLGVYAPQPEGLVSGPGMSLYVHNELLQDWLRWGIPGLMLVTALIIVLFLLGIRGYRSQPTTLVRAASVFLVMLPVPLMTAPFISTTLRWPTLVGLAAGLVARHLKELEHEQPQLTLTKDGPLHASPSTADDRSLPVAGHRIAHRAARR